MATFSVNDVWTYTATTGSLNDELISSYTYHNYYQDLLRSTQEAEINKLKQKGKKESNVSLLDRMCSIKEIEL